MGRPSRKTLFIRALLKEIETQPEWETYKVALYKEYILHLTTNEPRWMYDTIIDDAASYWDYMTKEVDPTLTPEELITDMGDYLDSPIIVKTIESLKDREVLPAYFPPKQTEQ